MLVGHFDKWGKFLLSCLLLWIRKLFQKGSTHEGDFAQMGAKSVLKELIPIENGATMENSRFAFLETVSLHSSLQSNRQADFCMSGIHL